MKKSVLTAALAVVCLTFGIANASAQGKKIGMAKARRIALEKASGKIEGSELEKENGKTVYSFDIRNAKGTITEVQVDAYTGAVVSVEEENKQQEAAEKAEEKREKKGKRKN